MNVVDMIFSTNTLNNSLIGDEAEGEVDLSMFQNMLRELFVDDEQSEALLQQFQLLKQPVNEDQLNMLALLGEEISEDETTIKQHELLNAMLNGTFRFVKEDSNLTENGHSEELMINEMAEAVDHEKIPEHIQAQLITLLQEVEKVLVNVKQDGDLQEASSKLIHLLERWSTINNLVSKQTSGLSKQNITLENEELQSLWRHVLEAYERRSKFSQKNQYETQAKVDQKDVIRWLQKALEEHTPRNVHAPNITQTAMPMSRIEQYVIHLQQSEGTQTQSLEQKLVDKFQQIINTNRFLTTNNGVNQMLFHLKPDNLGEMMVRLTEVNGEMTAKIIVTSEATRKALQSNIHQLKNMFSPHQVVIERQDELTGQQVQEEHEQSREKQEHEEHEKHPFHEENEQESNSKDEQESFHEILNEKV